MIRTPLFYSSVSSLCIIVRGSHLYPQNDNVRGLLHFCIIYPWPLLQAILISRALPFLFAECAKLLFSPIAIDVISLPLPFGLGEAPARRVSSPFPGIIVAMCLSVDYIRILNPSLAARCSYHLLYFVSGMAHSRWSDDDANGRSLGSDLFGMQSSCNERIGRGLSHSFR